jgi:hypothetical protein
MLRKQREIARAWTDRNGNRPMNIRFVSSLTPEDENAIAPALLAAISNILDLLPIAYTIRIDTSDSNVYQHTGAEESESPARHESHRGNIR